MVKSITKKIRKPRETKVKDKKIKEPKTKKKRKLKIASTSTEIIPSPQNKLEKSNNIDLKIVTDDNKMYNESVRLNEKFIDLYHESP